MLDVNEVEVDVEWMLFDGAVVILYTLMTRW